MIFYKWLALRHARPDWPVRVGDWGGFAGSYIRLYDREQACIPVHANDSLWIAEGRGDHIYGKLWHDFTQVRLVERVKTWDLHTRRMYGLDCAERVVDLTDNPPAFQEGIDAARIYERGFDDDSWEWLSTAILNLKSLYSDRLDTRKGLDALFPMRAVIGACAFPALPIAEIISNTLAAVQRLGPETEQDYYQQYQLWAREAAWQSQHLAAVLRLPQE